MRFYTKHHQYYCGIDLHAKTMYVCIIDQTGDILVHEDINCDPENLHFLIEPYLTDLVMAVECIFTWYWVADFCQKNSVTFVLGHALYMKAIHGSKTKNDKIDSHKIAILLRGGMLPMAYVYPAVLRSTRDLLRRRMHFVNKRAELLAHIQNTKSQYNLPDFQKTISYKRNRQGVVEHFQDASVQKSISMDLELIKEYDTLFRDIEHFLTQHAKEHESQQLFLLQTIPGVGKILALVILYEIENINRFDRVQNFCSYARLIKPLKESGGKTKSGGSNRKMGNAYLKWAFGEATLLLIRELPEVKELHGKLKNKHGKARALAIISHKLGRAVYYMLKNKQAFDMKRFIQN